MNINTVQRIVKGHFGYQLLVYELNESKRMISGTLYDTFHFQCFIKDGMFTAGLTFGSDAVFWNEFFGHVCISRCNYKAIKQILLIIDKYCRLRLSDEFLIAFDKAYKWQRF